MYIATGENFPDAVTAGAAGGSAAGPVLLVRQNSIPAATLGELNRLEPNVIVIVGGTAVISSAVEDQLKALSFSPNVRRNGGADRYETAALLSQDTFPETGAASCPGNGFFPFDPAVGWTGSEIRYSTGSGVVTFQCELSLPHRATVTKLSAGLDDTGSFGTACLLRRLNLVGGGFLDEIGKADTMATTLFTEGTSGKQVVETTNITDPLVNNFRYGYYVSCGSAPDLGIIGATVHYELTG